MTARDSTPGDEVRALIRSWGGNTDPRPLIPEDDQFDRWEAALYALSAHLNISDDNNRQENTSRSS